MIKEQTKTKYNQIADTWSNKVWAQSSEFNAKIIEFADLQGDEKSLDVGIGAGDLEKFLKQEHVAGIDISQSMINQCKARFPNYSLYVADAESLPFIDETFDFVYSRNLLRSFENPAKAFSEMYRVLKKDGKLMVIEGAVFDNERQYATEIVRIVEPYRPLFPSHEQLRNLFESNRLRNIEQKVEGLHRFWLKKFCLSKQATEEQKQQIIAVCKALPEWYRQKYKMAISDDEIENTLTFSFIKGIK